MKLPEHPPPDPRSDRIRQAIEVLGVVPGSGAAAAGLLAGDLIVGLDGKPIED